MDAIYAESAVLVDLSDRVLDSLFFESLDLIIIEHIKRLAISIFCCKWIREQPVSGDESAKLTVHYTTVTGKCHINCSGHVKDWHNSYVYRHCNTSLTD